MFWIFDGRYTPHPNSLLFNAFPGFWPFKMFWFFRKVSPNKLVHKNSRINVIFMFT